MNLDPIATRERTLDVIVCLIACGVVTIRRGVAQNTMDTGMTTHEVPQRGRSWAVLIIVVLSVRTIPARGREAGEVFKPGLPSMNSPVPLPSS